MKRTQTKANGRGADGWRMSRAWWLGCVGVVMSMASWVQADDGGRDEVDAARYEVLVERNIFSPTRGRQPDPPRRDPPPRSEPREAQPVDPGQSMVLRGFAVRGEQAVAMIEDGSGRLLRVGVGETVAGRRITAIAIDELEYERDDETQTVAIGMTLAGDAAPRVERQADRGGGADGASDRERAGGRSGGGSDVLERMRQRRQQAIGGGAGGDRESRRATENEREPDVAGEPEGEPEYEREEEDEAEHEDDDA
ncbi:hypothetical protein ACERK3_00335 [Phycisphaerales bacterium AB-hyl4]|uniref:Type II secretion system protein GspC N-terminal domain-containing protein n=1 Tax=Natronomicrosphaera hydrolytica TaxID=3242702 RepID=A0ABV4U1L3_9BACT